MTETGKTYAFVADDPYGLWRAGDELLDLGWESVPEAGVRLYRLLRTGETITLAEPWRHLLDVDPYFAPEAQETFLAGSRVVATALTHCVRPGGEGTYLGWSLHGALVAWDTPDGCGYRESVSFGSIRPAASAT